MERMNLKFKDAEKALQSLGDILDEPFSIIVRDATIQRFEYTFEAVWKLLKEYLKENEGIVCNSPKACFREGFQLGILTEDETVLSLEMTDRRNETAHTYKEKVAELIYSKTGGYFSLMSNMLHEIKRRI